jgi:predicted GIY-YIG superfamily endonuclease
VRDPRYYCVYIMGSLTGTLYIGVSGNLHKRVFQHKFHHYEGFTARYEVVRLLYFESYDDVHKALAREKQLDGRVPRRSHCSNAATHSGRTWPQRGTRGCNLPKAGMLRLRSEARFALLPTPLSMTHAISVMLSEARRTEGPPSAVEASL